jgi:hypothetical protein
VPRNLQQEKEAIASDPLLSKIPSILFEGDEPSAAPITAPGEKFATGPSLSPLPAEPEEDRLPEAYGTGRVFLTARDPHCLYAHWDLTAEQQRHYNSLSADQHLIVRTRLESPSGAIVNELPVHPESRHWFIHVDHAATRYVAELGYYPPNRQWRTIATAEPVLTPPEAVAEEAPIQFATIAPAPVVSPPPPPPAVPFPAPELVPPTAAQPQAPAPHWLPPAPAPAPAPPPWQQVETPPAVAAPGTVESFPIAAVQPPAIQPVPTPAPQVIQAPPPKPAPPVQFAAPPAPAVAVAFTPAPAPIPILAALTAAPVPEWTPAQESALADLVGWTLVRKEWIGSAEIEEVLKGKEQAERRRELPLRAEVSSLTVQPELPLRPGLPETISSPTGAPAERLALPAGLPEHRQFWFNVNAELVIYGATEPDARVTIAGRPIRLRPDGTFSYRFSLPDGHYVLPLAAISTDGEVRRATLEFERGSQYAGGVEAHPQDPALQPPRVENVL